MATSPVFHLRTLGELRLTGPAGEVLAGRRKELVLLTYLARRAPRAVPREELMALLWGERDEAKARQSLRHALVQLRRALPDAVEITNESARIADGRVELDVSALDVEVAGGRLASAVERWQGEFLAGTEDSGDDAYRAWLERERESLRRTVTAVFARLVADARDRNRPEIEVQFARRWAELFPLDSQACARLVDALLREGEIDDAHAVYDGHVAHLQSQLDAGPSGELLRLGQDLERMRRQTDGGRPGSAALLTPDIVGRDAILASLLELWARARESPAVVVIEGEEGIGKSRLCAELIRSVRRSERPALVLEARGVESDGETPWSTARRLFAPLTTLPALDDMPNKALVELSAILPALRQRFRHLGTPSEHLDRAEGALRDVLRTISARMSLLLVVDDVGVADAASRDLLFATMRDLAPATLLILTTRPDERVTPALAAELASNPSARRIKLQPLARSDVARLLDSMLQIAPADRDALADRVANESGGNPFYALELVSAMADAGILTLSSSGRWQIDRALASRTMVLPLSLRAAIRTRLSQLSDAARSILYAMAVQDAPLDADRARRDCGLSSEAFEGAFGELLSRRILRPAPDGGGNYEFSHELLRRVAAERAAAIARDTRDAASQEAVSQAARQDRVSPARRSWRIVAATAAVLVLAAGLAGIARWRSRSVTGAGSVAPRVAVLDLVLVARDTSQVYLTTGLADEITSSLSRFDRVRIKSRGAVRGLQAGMTDPIKVGEILGVDYLVEGSIQRVEDRLRVAVRLTKTADGFHVWGNDFEARAQEIPALHEQIAEALARKIGGSLSSAELTEMRRSLTADAQAFEQYLRGNVYLIRRTPPSLEQAIDHYQRALARDSAFSAARARIAYAYSLFADWGWRYRGLPRERLLRDGLELADAARRTDSTSADAWMATAYLLALRDPVRLRGAVESFERAIALDPHNTEARTQYAQTLQVLHRWDEARSEYRRIIAAEPDRAQAYMALASIEWKLARPREAQQLYDRAVLIDPSSSYLRSARAILRLMTGDLKGGREDAETAVRLIEGYSIPPHSVMAIALAHGGDQEGADQHIARAFAALDDPDAPGPTDARFLASALVAAGRHDEALTLLEKATPRGAWLWFYTTASDFAAIRSHPRFVRVLREARPADLGPP